MMALGTLSNLSSIACIFEQPSPILGPTRSKRVTGFDPPALDNLRTYEKKKQTTEFEPILTYRRRLVSAGRGLSRRSDNG